MKPFYTRTLIEDGQGNALVVVHRDRKVAMPGGKIENDEDSEVAAKREVFEETGLIVTDLVKVLEQTYEFNDGKHLGVFYRATAWSGTVVNNEPTKLLFVGWVPRLFLLSTQSQRLTDTLIAAANG